MAVLTVTRYRQITGDTVTAESTVTARIEEAAELVGDDLFRPLESAERTEVVQIERDGRAYPRVTPITAIPSASSYTVADTVTLLAVQPDAVISWDWPEEWLLYGTRPTATVVYTGGWTSATLPARLARAIALLARALDPARQESLVPAGAVSRSVLDVSISFGPEGAPDGLEGLVPGIRALIRPYRRRRRLS